MTNQNLTEILCIIDRSSSMRDTATEVIDGFNLFMEEQREISGDINVTLSLFHRKNEILFEGRSLDEIPKNYMNDENYSPMGSTSLYDAIGQVINSAGNRYNSMHENERPGKVMVLIMTDGDENSSQEFSKAQVAEMISTQQNVYSWDFIFIGANIDTESTSQDLKIRYSASYSQDVGQTKSMLRNVSRTVSSYRAGPLDMGTLHIADNEKKLKAGLPKATNTSLLLRKVTK